MLQESGMSTPPNPPQISRPQDLTSMPTAQAFPSPSSTASPPLRRLLDETSDLIDSPVFTNVLTLLLDATFSHLIDTKVRSEAYKLAPLTSSPLPESRIVEVTDPDPLTASTKLATILAVMSREAHKIANGVPNEYVEAIEAVSELEAFAAVVYSSNFEVETRSENTITPNSTASGRKDEIAGSGKDGKNEKAEGVVAAAEAEDMAAFEGRGGIMDSATGVVDAAWGGFESIWVKVTGSGESAMRG